MRDALEIEQRLLKNYRRHLVCQSTTDLVIEGYPRSANTFTVDMIRVLSEGRQKFNLAHHTHHPDNLYVAEAYDIPRLVLVREPVAAILSFMIYSGRSANFAIRRYVDFHQSILSLEKPYLTAPFTDVLADFNIIVAKLNTQLQVPLPFSDNLKRDTALAKAREIERAQKTHGVNAEQRVAIPSESREALKTKLRPDLMQILKTQSQPLDLYQEVISRGD